MKPASQPWRFLRAPVSSKAFLSTAARRLRPPPPPSLPLRPSLARSQLQILSDLHLEIGQQYSSFTFPVSAPYLLLGGDIGRLVDYDAYLKFLEAQVSRYEKVFLVLGNHEFYGVEYDAGIEKAKQLSREPSIANGLVLLDKIRWDDPKSPLTILGCTLWSAISEDSYGIVESKLNDFYQIGNWSAQRQSQVHTEEVAWLREQVKAAAAAHQHGDPNNNNNKRQILVATHHAPCVDGTARPEHTGGPLNCAFATDLLDQGGWDGVKLWAFGHTHYSTDFERNGIRVVANQRGYVYPASMLRRRESARTKVTYIDNFDPEMAISM